jgi:hypothetical protein
VRVQIRLKIKRSVKTKKSEIKKWDIGKLNKKNKRRTDQGGNIKYTKYSEKMDVINETWKKIKKGINEATGKTIGKQEDHKEIADLMKNVRYYSKIKRKLTAK